MDNLFGHTLTLNAQENEKIFLIIGTSEVGEWALNDKPFVIPVKTEEQFDEQGFDGYEFKMCQKLNVGEITRNFDYKGIYVMRVK